MAAVSASLLGGTVLAPAARASPSRSLHHAAHPHTHEIVRSAASAVRASAGGSPPISQLASRIKPASPSPARDRHGVWRGVQTDSSAADALSHMHSRTACSGTSSPQPSAATHATPVKSPGATSTAAEKASLGSGGSTTGGDRRRKSVRFGDAHTRVFEKEPAPAAGQPIVHARRRNTAAAGGQAQPWDAARMLLSAAEVTEDDATSASRAVPLTQAIMQARNESSTLSPNTSLPTGQAGAEAATSRATTSPSSPTARPLSSVMATSVSSVTGSSKRARMIMCEATIRRAASLSADPRDEIASPARARAVAAALEDCLPGLRGAARSPPDVGLLREAADARTSRHRALSSDARQSTSRDADLAVLESPRAAEIGSGPIAAAEAAPPSAASVSNAQTASATPGRDSTRSRRSKENATSTASSTHKNSRSPSPAAKVDKVAAAPTSTSSAKPRKARRGLRGELAQLCEAWTLTGPTGSITDAVRNLTAAKPELAGLLTVVCDVFDGDAAFPDETQPRSRVPDETGRSGRSAHAADSTAAPVGVVSKRTQAPPRASSSADRDEHTAASTASEKTRKPGSRRALSREVMELCSSWQLTGPTGSVADGIARLETLDPSLSEMLHATINAQARAPAPVAASSVAKAHKEEKPVTLQPETSTSTKKRRRSVAIEVSSLLSCWALTGPTGGIEDSIRAIASEDTGLVPRLRAAVAYGTSPGDGTNPNAPGEMITRSSSRRRS